MSTRKKKYNSKHSNCMLGNSKRAFKRSRPIFLNGLTSVTELQFNAASHGFFFRLSPASRTLHRETQSQCKSEN